MNRYRVVLRPSSKALKVIKGASSALQALGLNNSTIAENSVAGTVVGSILNKSSGSTLSLSNDAGGRFTISGGNLVAAATPTNYEAATSHSVTIVETLTGAVGSPRSTTLTVTVVNVSEQPNLAALTGSLSIAENSANGSVVGTPTGYTAGSTKSLSDDASGRFSINASTGQITVANGSLLNYEAATSHNITIVETLADSANSPRSTTLAVSVSNVFEQPSLAALTGSLSVPENSANTTIVGTPTGYTAGSTKSLSDNAAGRFAINASTGQVTVADGSLLNYEAATSHNITIVETLADSANSPRSTTLAIAVSNLNDTSPSAFSFTDVPSAPLSTLETSNTITIAGLGASDSATASISGDASSQLQKNGGTWGAGPVTVVNGDTLAVRHTSSASASTAVNTTLTVGATSDTFTSTTVTGAVPVNTVAPAISGDAVVGQTLYASTGTWTNAPTGYAYQWYADGGSGFVAIGGATNDALLVNDNDAGKTFKVGVVATNGTGPSAETRSAATAATVAIDLTNAITAFTRTSASGVTPMTWNITFGAKVYAGYMTRWEVFSSGSIMDNTTRVQDVYYELTNDDLQSGANLSSGLAAAGLTAPTATQYLRPTVYTNSPNGLGYSYVGPAISPTDAVVAMTWSATDKFGTITLSNGNLTAVGVDGSGVMAIRTNRSYPSTGKFYVEYKMNNANMYAAVANATATLSQGGNHELFGDGAANANMATYWKNGFTDYNGSANSGYATYVTGDGVDMAVDVDAKKVWWRVAAADGASAGSWLPGASANPATGVGGLDISAMGSAALYPAAQFANGGQCTMRFSGFTRTPPAGFVAP
jgi:hypothetical protein